MVEKFKVDIRPPVAPLEEANESPEFTDVQFESALRKAKKPLEAMADKARKSLKNGTARKFPA